MLYLMRRYYLLHLIHVFHVSFLKIWKYTLLNNEVTITDVTNSNNLVRPNINKSSYLKVPVDKQEVTREKLVLSAAQYVKAEWL